MWFDPDDPATITQQRIRHEALQSDKLDSYGWVRHDGRSYGRQQLLDGDYQLSVQMVSNIASAAGILLSCYDVNGSDVMLGPKCPATYLQHGARPTCAPTVTACKPLLRNCWVTNDTRSSSLLSVNMSAYP